MNTVFLLTATLWLPHYIQWVLKVAIPILEIPQFQKIASYDISLDGSVLQLNVTIEGRAEEYPRLEPLFKQAVGDTYYPSIPYKIDLKITSPFSAKFADISLIAALILSLPKRKISVRLSWSVLAGVMILAMHVFLFVFYEQALVFDRIYEPSFVLSMYRALANLAYLDNLYLVIFVFLVLGTCTGYGVRPKDSQMDNRTPSRSDAQG